MSIKKIKELMQSRSNEPTNIHSNSKYANHGAASQLNQLMSKHGFEHNLWCTKLQLEQYKLTALNQVAFEISLPLNKTYLFNIGQTNIAERIKEYDEKIAIREAKEATKLAKEASKLPKEAKYVQEYEEKIKKLEYQILEIATSMHQLENALNRFMNCEKQEYSTVSAISNTNETLERFNEEHRVEDSAQVEKQDIEPSAVIHTSSTVKKATKHAENWEEKYRPKIFSEIILPNNMAKYFAYVISNNEKANIGLFSKTPGVGKSSLVKVLENELSLDLKSVNASNTRGIDFIRSDVMKFATTRTWEGGRKYVAFEESDQLTSDAQKLLKTEIERLNGHCQFIFTANDKSKLDEAVLSRLVVFDLDEEFENDQTNVMDQMVNRLLHITTLESCSIEKSVIESTVIEHYPSMRNMTLHLARYCRINC